MHAHKLDSVKVSQHTPAYRVSHCLNLSIMENVGSEVIADLVKAGLTYTAISERLRQLYPHITGGLSSESVRRHCVANGLRTTRPIVTDEELDESVARALAKVCIISLAIYVPQPTLKLWDFW